VVRSVCAEGKLTETVSRFGLGRALDKVGRLAARGRCSGLRGAIARAQLQAEESAHLAANKMEASLQVELAELRVRA
jgi:hypothetical protein